MSQQSQSLHLITDNPALKNQLQRLATQDFEAFLNMLNVDGLQIFICNERKKELSYEQIALRLRRAGITITRQSVGDRCNKCKE
jgi:hypothetical protein